MDVLPSSIIKFIFKNQWVCDCPAIIAPKKGKSPISFYFTRTREEATNEAKTPKTTMVANTMSTFKGVMATG